MGGVEYLFPEFMEQFHCHRVGNGTVCIALYQVTCHWYNILKELPWSEARITENILLF